MLNRMDGEKCGAAPIMLLLRLNKIIIQLLFADMMALVI